MLDCAGEGLEGEGYGEARDEVDVADVGEELVVVEGEFAKGKVDVGVGVGRVEDGGFDEGGSASGAAWVAEEGELGILAEPDAASCDLGNCDGDGVVGWAEGDCTVLG